MTATTEPNLYALPLKLLETWAQYLVDSAERTVLFWDVMRKHGNTFLENAERGEPPVLTFGYDVLIDGRTLERPCNYALMAIQAPQGVTVNPAKRPVVVVNPRAGQGAGVGGFKLDSEIGFALAPATRSTSSGSTPSRCPAKPWWTLEWPSPGSSRRSSAATPGPRTSRSSSAIARPAGRWQGWPQYGLS